jgi:O-antigen/teichoic acid export membrane protein
LGLARGYLQFGASRTLGTSLAVAGAAAIWVAWAGARSAETRGAIVVACLSLPAGALAHFGVEALSAAGRPALALALFKLCTPTVALGLAALLLISPITMDGRLATVCWGAAWALTLGLMTVALWRVLPPALLRTQPDFQGATWRAEARPFLIHRMSLALLGQSGLIALDLLQPSAAAVGAYAAAAGTAGLVTVLATATNRAFARSLALLLEARDYRGIVAMHRQRLLWLGPPITLFLLATLLAPGRILAMFRREFVAAGTAPLRLLALAAAFSVVFALTPTYLKFQRRNRTIYLVTALAGAAQLGLLVLLIPPLGASGAALAYTLSTVGMYGAFAVLLRRDVNALL